MKKLLTMMVLVFGLSASAFGQDAGNFIRYAKGKDPKSGELQIAKATYVHPTSKVKVVMYGVVHVADKAYYDAVQKDLDSYTAVLYEGVGTPAEKKAMKGKSSLSTTSLMQKLMCDVLGLEYQLQAINYKTPKNFVHADMSAAQFSKAMGGGGGPAGPLPEGSQGFLDTDAGKMAAKLGSKFIKMIFDSNPEWRSAAKLQMASQLTASTKDGKVPGMSEKMYDVIVTQRNKIVMNVLKRESTKRKAGTLCVFYGAAHMPDFHKRMTALGYRQTTKTWKAAWTLGTGAVENKGVKPAPKKKKKVPTPKKRKPVATLPGKWY